MTLEEKIRRRFHKGCVEHELLEDGDKILVAISGGKDSMTLLHLLTAQAKLYKPKIKVEAAHVIMDNIPYKNDLSYLEYFCKERGSELHILHTQFDESTDTGFDRSSLLALTKACDSKKLTNHRRKTKCFLCAWNRRKALFEYAVANGFNKVALGHHEDDILISLLMSMTFEGSIQTMPPKLKMENYPLTIIRPLCRVAEKDIKELAEAHDYKRQSVPCPYETETRRNTMTEVFHHLEKINPEARYSLWSSMGNIKADLLP